MCYDLVESVGSRKHWLWDITRKRNEFLLFSIVLRILLFITAWMSETVDIYPNHCWFDTLLLSEACICAKAIISGFTIYVTIDSLQPRKDNWPQNSRGNISYQFPQGFPIAPFNKTNFPININRNEDDQWASLLKVPGPIASDFSQTFLRFWYQKKPHIFLITLGEFYSWKMYRLEDINENVTSCGNQN